MPIDDRYQNQPWYVKLWRRRHYLYVPIMAIGFKRMHPEDPWGLAWSISIGLAQSRMKWYYTLEECGWDLDEDD